MNEIKHDFIQPNDDEYITCDGYGFHIVKEWDGDGKVECRAEPGEWVETSAGRVWASRITRFHSVLGNHDRVN